MNRILPGHTVLLILLATALAACSSEKAPEAASESHAEAAEADHHDEDAHEGEHAEDHGESAEGHHDDHGEEGESDFARIDPASAAQHGIQVAQAAAGIVAESISLTGRLIIDPRRVALVRARFAGPVRSIAKEIGDPVQKNDVLAQVESNDSLTVYDVRSPIAGVVLERMTNVGDVAGTEPIFRVGDLSSLQAELKVFRSDQGRVQRGAEAIVRIGDQDAPGKVVNFVPEIDSRTQAMLVRIDLKPRGPLGAAPGQFVTGQIMTGQRDAAVAIPADAVQRLEEREVIFVPEEEGFRMRAVTIGRRSLDRAEVIAGLAPGESYVSAGAFLIKAEIGKSMAGHDH